MRQVASTLLGGDAARVPSCAASCSSALMASCEWAVVSSRRCSGWPACHFWQVAPPVCTRCWVPCDSHVSRRSPSSAMSGDVQVDVGKSVGGAAHRCVVNSLATEPLVNKGHKMDGTELASQRE